METEHKVSGTVKAYLLGQLEGDEAAALEEKYFMDRSFFLQVQGIEQQLIEEYLGNRLPSDQREQFESRYLQVPALRQRLAEVREEMARSVSTPRSESAWAWRVAFAACLLLAVGTIAWIYVHHHRGASAVIEAKHPKESTSPRPAPVTTAQTPGQGARPSRPAKSQPPQKSNSYASAHGPVPANPPANQDVSPKESGSAALPEVAAALTVNLSPRKGVSGAMPLTIAFQLPEAGGSVRLVVDIEGRSIVSRTAEIWVPGQGARWSKLWSSNEKVVSVPVNGGQELSVTVDSSLFPASGLYALRLIGPEEKASEAYRFHVTVPR